MKNLLTHGREVVLKHEEMLPERDRNKIRRSRKERATVVGIEHH